MATPPTFTIRLPDSDRANLEEMARVFGAKSAGGFVAEMIGALCSGDQERCSAFVGKLMTAMGEQLTLDLKERVKREVAKAKKKGGRRARKT